MLVANDWEDFSRKGFLHLGQVLTVEEVEALQKRADDFAMGIVTNPDVQMQLDTGGDYEKLAAVVSHFQEGTRFYRKIQGLENDPLFLRNMSTSPPKTGACAEPPNRCAGSY
jgi:hypothetical protein